MYIYIYIYMIYILTNKITRSLNIAFVDRKYYTIVLSYYVFDFTR